MIDEQNLPPKVRAERLTSQILTLVAQLERELADTRKALDWADAEVGRVIRQAQAA